MKLRHSLLTTALLGIFALPLHAVQGYYRSPVLQQDHIVFTAEGDLWQASLNDMIARRLSSHLAEESQPVLSPDGKQLAFVADYDGASEIYLMPVAGGVAKRISYENSRVRIQQWLADGRILYATDSAAGPANYWLLKTLNPQTLKTETLPLADASVEPAQAEPIREIALARQHLVADTAIGQRVRNTQPDGGLAGLGKSPCSRGMVRRCAGSGMGAAASRARV